VPGKGCRYNDPTMRAITPSTEFPVLRPITLGLALAACLAGLAGCSSPLRNVSADTFKPYVPEVVQGNFVSREQRQALRLGMPRNQVRDVLGTPLLASVFHADRWDYTFSIRRQGVPPQAFRLTVYFKDDRLIEIDSDDLPSETEFVGRLAGRQNMGKPPVLQLSDEEIRRLPVRPPSDVPPPPELPRNYPPLEPTVR